jgi:hypothetical protein
MISTRTFTLALLSTLVAVVPAVAQVQPVSKPVAGQVSVGGSPLEAWRSVMLPSLDVMIVETAVQGPNVVVLSARGGAWTRAAVQGPIAGTSAGMFETDFAPVVTKIAFEPLVQDLAPNTPGGVRLQTYVTTRRKPGLVTFTVPLASARAAATWANDAALKSAAPRDVNITLKGKGGAVRTYILHRCLPWRTTPQGTETTFALKPESVDFKATDRLPFFQWLTAGAAQNLRDVRFVAADGSRDVTMKMALIAEYVFPTLERGSSAEAIEGFGFQPGEVVGLP